MKTILTLFTPGEAQRITDVATVMQRDWRRRGFLPSGDGHARFDVFSLAELWALKLLADRGIGPQQGKEVVDWLAIGIVGYALQFRDAYEGEHDEFEHLMGAGDSADDLHRVVEKIAEKARPGDKFDLSGAPASWLASANTFARQILREHGRVRGAGRVMPARFFVWWADGTHRWDQSIDASFSATKSEAATTGAVVVIDQFALGKALAGRAGRPLVHVERAD